MKQKLLYICLMILCALAWSGKAWGDNHLPLTISSSNFKDIVSGNGVSWDNAPKRYQVWPPKQYYTNTGIRVNNGKTATLTFTGIPDKLSFTYEKQEAATGIGWAVKEYTNGAWKQIWTSSDGEGSANIQLSPDVRIVQLCWNGNTLTGVFSDVTISELHYFSVEPTSLDFGSTNYLYDGSLQKTFKVKHCNAGSNVTLTSNDANYTVSPATLTTTGRDKMGEDVVTVTYSNTAVGAHNSTITISDSNNTAYTNSPVNVSVTGTTLNRYMMVNKSSMSFGTNYKGETVAKQSFVVSHCNLSGNIAVSSNNANFTVSSSSISTGLGTTSTATINVTYVNQNLGSNTGTITIHDNSGKVANQTINLSGTTRDRYLRTATESVNFGIVDEDATAPDKTFDITHLNLSANITVSYSGDNVFSVTPTSITTATDNNEKTSTVTAHFYNTIPGDYSGTITVTDNSGKCSALVITVTGSSKSLSIVLDPLSPDYEDSYYKNITLSRTLKAGYSTIALPFDTDVAELVAGRAEAYDSDVDWVAQLDIVTYNAQDGYTLYFQKVAGGTITANQPYVLHLGYEVKDPTWTDTTNGITVATASAASVTPSTGYSGYESWSMCANYEAGFPMAGKYGIVNNSKLTGTNQKTYPDGGLMLGSGENAKLNAFTAYITGPTSGPNGAPRLRVAYVDEDGTATVVEGFSLDSDEPVAIYGPDGQRRSKMQPGVNIVRYSDGSTRKVRF